MPEAIRARWAATNGRALAGGNDPRRNHVRHPGRDRRGDPSRGTRAGLAQLQIEVTERVFLGCNVGVVAEALDRLHRRGVSILLDDFGTGYASLTYLRQFPIDKLKIDRSFVGGVVHDPNDAAIVRAIIELGARPRPAGRGRGRGDAGPARVSSPAGLRSGAGLPDRAAGTRGRCARKCRRPELPVAGPSARLKQAAWHEAGVMAAGAALSPTSNWTVTALQPGCRELMAPSLGAASADAASQSRNRCMQSIGKWPGWAWLLFTTAMLVAIGAAPREAAAEALELKDCEIPLPTGKCITPTAAPRLSVRAASIPRSCRLSPITVADKRSAQPSAQIPRRS